MTSLIPPITPDHTECQTKSKSLLTLKLIAIQYKYQRKSKSKSKAVRQGKEVLKVARLVDVIEEMIKQLVDENNGSCTINRSQLAEKANCVPSQVTYVLSTRFSSGNGYIVESRRGGGGQITITRARYMTSEDYLHKMMDSVGDDMTQQQAKNLLASAVSCGAISAKEGTLIMSAVSDRALAKVEPDIRSVVRADILKNAILALIIT